jgi:hypothetical protein
LELINDESKLPLTAFDMWNEQAKSFPSTATSLVTTDMYRNLASAVFSDAAGEGEDREDQQDQDQEPTTPVVDASAVDKSEYSDTVSSGRAKIDSLSEADMEALQCLSVAMQRCYNTLRALAANDKSVDFIDPVDPKTHPMYYELVRNPIFLDDIRRCILSGGYEDSIYRFYKDVMIVFENAQIVHPELSPIAQNAHKLAFVFERLFLEMVLCYDNPITYHHSCNFCRELISENDYRITCERCEGSFHIGCLCLRTVPKGDWLCNNCVLQRGVNDVHPYRNAEFIHPKNGKGCRVISVNQVKKHVQFLASIDGDREYFSGADLRRALSAGTDIQLPAGYSHEDYDAVCGLAQGYSGWGKPHCMFYPNDVYSQVALERRVDDPHFEDLVRALAALGFASSNEDFGHREWIAIFSALSNRIMMTTKLDSVKLDDQQDATAATQASSSTGIDRQQSFESLLDPTRLVSSKLESIDGNLKDVDTKKGSTAKEKYAGNGEENEDGNNEADENNKADMEDENFVLPGSAESFETLLKPEERWERRRLSRLKVCRTYVCTNFIRF